MENPLLLSTRLAVHIKEQVIYWSETEFNPTTAQQEFEIPIVIYGQSFSIIGTVAYSHDNIYKITWNKHGIPALTGQNHNNRLVIFENVDYAAMTASNQIVSHLLNCCA